MAKSSGRSQKQMVFISHITEESQIAGALKKLVEDSFINMIDVFVASDPGSIPVGQKWLDVITDGLKVCAIEIVIASPASVKRPWINFEAGAGWIREIPVVPLCHSGMRPNMLPEPMNLLQGAVATEEAQLKLLFPVIATALGSAVPEPDFSEFIETVRSYEKTSAMIAASPELVEGTGTNDVSHVEQTTLIATVEKTTNFEEGIAISYVERELESGGWRPLAIKLAIKSLERKGFVTTKLCYEGWGNNESFTTISVTEAGWRWLDQNQHRFDWLLRNQADPPPQTNSDFSEPPQDEITF